MKSAIFMIAVAVLALAPTAFPQSSPASCVATITSFDAPNAISTEPSGMNAAGVIAGSYADASSFHGFVRDSAGTITSFDPPNSVFTKAVGINNSGTIAGYFEDSLGGTHGFVRDSGGTFTTFDAPGSTYTQPASINDAGVITGYYIDAGVVRGFVRDSGGVITTFDPPGSTGTQPASINAGGAITGFSFDALNVVHGFLRDSGGAFTIFDPPGSVDTQPTSINDSGTITGNYIDAANVIRGFVRNSAGSFTTFDPPGSTSTFPQSINASGDITGSYIDAANHEHGFVRDSSGSFATFDPPGSLQTLPTSINVAGAIAGEYLYQFGGDGPPPLYHGFVRTCSNGDSYQLRYFANLDRGDSYINLTNAGTLNGFDPAGRICVNAYTFDPAEELISCCACPVTPNGLNSLSVRNDLISNTLTPGVPTSVTVKLLASVPGAGGTCDPSTASPLNLVRGMRAWATTLHLNTAKSPAAGYQETETPFSKVELSLSELTKLTGFCSFIQANGSGFGICKSCRGGALGGNQR